MVQENIQEIIEDLGIGRAEYWAGVFNSLEPHKIGVIKVSGKLLCGDSRKQLCDEISYLTQRTGFYLPVVIGGGVQYDSLGQEKVNGIRITPKKLIGRIEEIAKQNQKTIVSELKRAGTGAHPLPYEYVHAIPRGYEIDSKGNKIDVGYVGDRINIDTQPVIQCIEEKKVPVLTHLGSSCGETYNINATTMAKELVKYLGAKKLIIVGDTPILDRNGKIIKSIHSELECKQLIKDRTISDGMITNVLEAYDLLSSLGPGHSVQITALKKDPSGRLRSTGLLEELLGDGSGTKIDYGL